MSTLANNSPIAGFSSIADTAASAISNLDTSFSANETLRGIEPIGAHALSLPTELTPVLNPFPSELLSTIQDIQQKFRALTYPVLSELSDALASISKTAEEIFEDQSFLDCCQNTEWPVFFIATAEMKGDLVDLCGHCPDSLSITADISDYLTQALDTPLIRRLEAEWLKNKSLSSRRKPLLSQALKHHIAGDYHASTSILMCQLGGLIEDQDESIRAFASMDDDTLMSAAQEIGAKEGIVARRQNALKRNNPGNMKDRPVAISASANSNILFWQAAVGYIANVTLTNQENGLAENNPLRNKICHGVQTNFGTQIHSLKAILVIDIMIKLGNLIADDHIEFAVPSSQLV